MTRAKKRMDEDLYPGGSDFLETDEIIPETGAKKFSEGQRVKFYGTHDKSNQFTGRIVRMHEDSDLIDISAEPDGKAIEVETVLTAHSSDVTPLED
jgi:hypothetical protein